MLNYMKAECYKVTRRKYPFVFLLVILLGEGFLWFFEAYSNYYGASNTVDSMVSMLLMLLILGLYAAVIVCDMVFSDQYKHNTLKNEVSFGIPRVRVYLGKLLSSALVAIVLMAVVIGAFLGVSALLLPTTEETGMYLALLGRCLLMALPLWLGALGVTMALFFTLRSNVAAAFAAVGILGVLPGGLKLVFLITGNDVFLTLRQFCLSVPFDYMDGSWASCGTAWAIGMGWLVVSTLIGIILYQRKEIN